MFSLIQWIICSRCKEDKKNAKKYMMNINDNFELRPRSLQTSAFTNLL